MILNSLRAKGFLDRRKKTRLTQAEEFEQEVEELVEVSQRFVAQLNHDPEWIRRALIKIGKAEKETDYDGCDCDRLSHDNT